MEEQDRYPTMLPLSRVEGRSRDTDPALSGISTRTLPPVGVQVAALLPAILEAVPASIVVIDEQNRLVLVNAAARRLLSVEENSLLGYSAVRFLSEERLLEARQVLRSRDGKYSYRDQLNVAGVERELVLEADLLNTERGAFLCVTLRDQTDQDRTWEEWSEAGRPVSSDRLERAHHLEALGHLAGSLAHDFNNLLAVILGSVEAAQQRVKRGLDPLADLDRAVVAAERSMDATSQILHYTRRRDNVPSTVSPGRVLSAFQGLLERAVGNEARLQLAFEETPAIRVEEAQLETALLNLVINARDALADQGTIQVSLGTALLDAQRAQGVGLAPGEYVVVVVADDGMGMSQEIQERVFEPFFTTKPPGVGTGLGLSTVYSLMRRLGGAVRLWSAPERGTRVELYFPAVEDE